MLLLPSALRLPFHPLQHQLSRFRFSSAEFAIADEAVILPEVLAPLCSGHAAGGVDGPPAPPFRTFALVPCLPRRHLTFPAAICYGLAARTLEHNARTKSGGTLKLSCRRNRQGDEHT